MNVDILCETLTLQDCTDHWPNNDCWTLGCICRRHRHIWEINAKSNAIHFIFTTANNIAILFLTTVLLLLWQHFIG